MKVTKNRVVTFTYELRLSGANGEQLQKVGSKNPVTIIIGHGNIMEPFENRLAGKATGDHFEFLIPHDRAYGKYNKKAVTTFEKAVLIEENGVDASLFESGEYIPMETEEGIPFNGKVMEVDETRVVLDFNHPLAGQDLYFTGEILQVREATEEEISSGLVR